MALARGHLIAFLDADDCWGPGYLKEMMPLARAHGLAFARSHVHAPDGQMLTVLGSRSRWLRRSDFGIWPGSFHPVLQAGVSPGFDTGPAQDVLHALRLVDAAGGRARLADQTFYRINLRQGSVTADPRFGHRVDFRYRDDDDGAQPSRGTAGPDAAPPLEPALAGSRPARKRLLWIFCPTNGQ